MTPLHISTVLNSVISNNKKQVKQVPVSKKVKVQINTIKQQNQTDFIVCYKILILIHCFKVKKIKSKE